MSGILLERARVQPLLAGFIALAAAACSPPAQQASTPGPAQAPGPPSAPAQPVAADVPAGAYSLDKTHASLVFRVNHMGFSNYTARFADFDAKLQLDPAKPEAASLTATIDPRSLELPAPPAGFEDAMKGPQWLDAAKYPEMSFRSTRIERTGADSARVTGDFTLHGATRPVVLEAKFNGGYPGMAMDPNARIGFSARGVLKRSEFGIAYGIPPAGSKMGVGDEVEFLIETEFTGPAFKAPG